VVEALMSSPRPRQTPRRRTRKRKRGRKRGRERRDNERIRRGGRGDVHLYVSYTLDIHILFTPC
jgi:hypothetical protein